MCVIRVRISDNKKQLIGSLSHNLKKRLRVFLKSQQNTLKISHHVLVLISKISMIYLIKVLNCLSVFQLNLLEKKIVLCMCIHSKKQNPQPVHVN